MTHGPPQKVFVPLHWVLLVLEEEEVPFGEVAKPNVLHGGVGSDGYFELNFLVAG